MSYVPLTLCMCFGYCGLALPVGRPLDVVFVVPYSRQGVVRGGLEGPSNVGSGFSTF